MTLRLCTICARGGSKGVPGKNIRMMLGKPLIAHSIERAKESGLFDVIVASSDSDAILAAAKEYGADIIIKRPAELANDAAGKHPAIHHAILEAEKQTGKKYGTFVDLDVTSPLRIIEDIAMAVNEIEKSNVSSILSAGIARHSPYYNMVEVNSEDKVALVKPLPTTLLSRQVSPKCYGLNGSVYVFSRKPYMPDPKSLYSDTRLLIMPEYRAFDIDSELDFDTVEMIMQKGKFKTGDSYII